MECWTVKKEKNCECRNVWSSFAVNSANGDGDVKIDGQHVSANPADCAWIMNRCMAAQGEGEGIIA